MCLHEYAAKTAYLINYSNPSLIMSDKKTSLKIGITGHRNLTEPQLTMLMPVVKTAIDNIICYQSGISHPQKIVFSTPLAKGADTLFAKVALTYDDAEIHVLLPFEKEEYLKDFGDAKSKSEFEELLKDKKVTSVECLGHTAKDDRNSLYLNVGKKIVSGSDYIIALWDEEPARGVGGTGDIVRYARKLKKNVLVINPSQVKPGISAHYLTGTTTEADNKIIVETSGPNPAENFYKTYDKLARKYQKRYKKLWQTTFMIGWLGVALILGVKVAVRLPDAIEFMLTVVEILSLAIIFALINREKSRSYHSKYLQYRFIAEVLRVDELYYFCGFYPAKFETKAIHEELHQFAVSPVIRHARKMIVLTTYSGLSFSKKKTEVERFITQQIDYHHNRKQRLHKLNKQNSYTKMACLIIFACLLLVHSFFEFRDGDFRGINISQIFHCQLKNRNTWDQLLELAYLFIPATLARFEAVKYLNDWEKLINKSNVMDKYFRGMKEKLHDATNDFELHQMINSIAENMYWENLDWEMFMKGKNENLT